MLLFSIFPSLEKYFQTSVSADSRGMNNIENPNTENPIWICKKHIDKTFLSQQTQGKIFPYSILRTLSEVFSIQY